MNMFYKECPERHVPCDNTQLGCKWLGRNKLRLKHECQYSLEKCNGCNGHFTLINLKRHKEQQCPGRPSYKKCKYICNSLLLLVYVLPSIHV